MEEREATAFFCNVAKCDDFGSCGQALLRALGPDGSYSALSKIRDTFRWFLPELEVRVELARISESVARDGYCLSFLNPVLSGLQAKRASINWMSLQYRAVVKCTKVDPYDSEECNWEITDNFPATPSSWMPQLRCDATPSTTQDEWELPRETGSENMQTDCDGNWYYTAIFKVYLYYPPIPARPEDGIYWLVSSEGLVTEGIVLDQGWEENAARLRKIAAVHAKLPAIFRVFDK